MNKKFLLKSLIITLSLIGFIWFVSAVAPDSPSSPNYPSDGATSIEINPILNVTVTDADSSSLNVSFYKNATHWNIYDASYDNVNISTQDSSPSDLFFKSDGTSLYEVGGSTYKIYQYTCSDAWNLSSCSYDNINISTQHQGSADYGPEDLFFKSDGTKLYEIGNTYGGEHGPPINRIYQYTCSDAWNLSSCSYDSVYISTQATYPQGLFFKSDGTSLYEVGGSTYKIYQYTCSDAWNLSSCSYDSVYISTNGYSEGLFFKSDGLRLYNVGGSSGNQKIYQYTCSDAWNLSSCSYDSMYISTQDSYSEGLFFKSDGAKMYEVGSNGDKIYQYSINTDLLNISINVANNSYATYTWNDLSEGTIYKWFVNVTDGTDTTQSSVWNFTIDNIPNIILNSPSNKQVFSVNTTSVILNLTVTDADNDTMNVTFYNLSDDSTICANTSISNGSNVICNWTGLSDGIYGWYVNVTDGTETNTSSTSNFSILSSFCNSNITSNYTMSSSIYCNNTAIYLDNDVTFNCDDNSVVFVGLNNTGYYAFNVSFVDNITIQNCSMKGFGIYAENATNLDILDNEIYNVSDVNTNAITIKYGENITIERNLFNATDVLMDECSTPQNCHQYRHWKAIVVNTDTTAVNDSTRNLTIYNNTIFDHEWAISISGVTNVNVSRNNFNITELYRGMTISLRYVINGIFDRNIQYRTIDDDWYIDSDGYVVDTGSSNITISNGNITNINVHGIIFLDMAGTDDYPQNVTIENMTIRNCVYSAAMGISFHGLSSSYAVYTENSSVIGNNISLCSYGIQVGGPYGGASDSRFINNTIYDIDSYGFFDTNTQSNRADNLFENNVVYNTGGTGFLMSGSENSSFINNLVYDTDGHGISVDSNCNLTGNIIRNVTRGIQINGDNNNISSNTIEENDYSIYLSGADNNYFYNMDASDSIVADIYATSASSTNNYFTNVSHNKSDISVQNSANISFNWYLDAHATDIYGANLRDVTITGLDKNNNQRFSDTTNSAGDIERQTVEEYYQDQSGRTYFTSYTISASKQGYLTESTIQNITDNTLLQLRLSWDSSPGGNGGGGGGGKISSNASDNESVNEKVPEIEEKGKESFIEQIKEGNFSWLIVLGILIVAILIIITKKLKERNLKSLLGLKKGFLVSWKI